MAAPAIGRRTRWAPGPSAQIDWSHPLAAGLVSFVTLGNCVDHVTGHQPTVVGTDHGSTIYGQGATTFSSTAYWQLGSGAFLGDKPQFSVFAGVRGASANLTYGRPIYCERHTSGNDILKMECCGWSAAGDDGAVNLTYRDNAGAIIGIGGTTSMVNRQGVAGVVRRSTTEFEVWLDGVRETSGTEATMTATFTDPVTQRIGIDPASTTNNFSDGVVTWLGRWARALSPNEVTILGSNPFDLLRS